MKMVIEFDLEQNTTAGMLKRAIQDIVNTTFSDVTNDKDFRDYLAGIDENFLVMVEQRKGNSKNRSGRVALMRNGFDTKSYSKPPENKNPIAALFEQLRQLRNMIDKDDE